MDPQSNSAERDLRIALLSLAARLRSQGAGRTAIRSALQQEVAAIRVPPVSAADTETLIASMASIPPEMALGAVEELLQTARLQGPSATPQPAADAKLPFPVHTAGSVGRDTPAAVDWIAEPWAAAGALTAITGRPKIGKTTFVLGLVAAVLAGRSFLGRPTYDSPFPQGKGGQGVRSVVYLTEQQPSSFRAALDRAGLLAAANLDLVFWHESMAVPWPRVVAGAAALCRAHSARLVVIDTLSQWAGMRGDMENQAGDAFAALQPLQQLAASGAAVIFIQHERKIGGDAADAGRGSSAFAGAVDTLIGFRRPPGDARTQTRMLLSLSRFEAVPPELYIELRNGCYSVIGETSDFATQRTRNAVLAALSTFRPPSPLEEEGPGMRGDQAQRMRGSRLADIMQATGISRPVATRAVNALVAAGQLRRDGTGTRNDPYRYSLPPFSH